MTPRKLTLALAILSSLAAARAMALPAQEQAAPTRITLKQLGADAVRVSIPFAVFRHPGLGQGNRRAPVSFVVPVGVAEKLARAAAHGVRLSTAQDLWRGPQLRIVAGRGKNAVIVDRTSVGAENGQAGYGVVRVQLGLGARAQAFFVGRTRDGKNLGQGTFTYGSGDWLLTHGVASLIDPASLDVKAGASLNGRKLQWYKKVTTRKITSQPTKALTAPGVEGVGGQLLRGGPVLVGAVANLELSAGLKALLGM